MDGRIWCREFFFEKISNHPFDRRDDRDAFRGCAMDGWVTRARDGDGFGDGDDCVRD